MGHDKHILTFPVNHGKTLNLVAFRTTSKDWPDAQRLTRSGELDELLQEFKDYGPAVIKLLKLLDPKLNVVSNSFSIHILLLNSGSGRYLTSDIPLQPFIKAAFASQAMLRTLHLLTMALVRGSALKIVLCWRSCSQTSKSSHGMNWRPCLLHMMRRGDQERSGW